MNSTTQLIDQSKWQDILGRLAAKQNLDTETAEAALTMILLGKATEAQISAFIIGLRIKGETTAELIGLQRAMVSAATPLSVPEHSIDIVGSGGAPSRKKYALNVSTMAAFVAAGAGAVVCKHGNVKASSTSGSVDLLTELGVDAQIKPSQLEKQVQAIGLGFAYARIYHPAMRHVAAVRSQIGIPTVFNILGPLSHPGRIKRQVVGVSDWSIAKRVVSVLAANGSFRALVVVGDKGLDEFSTTGPSRVLSLDNGVVSEWIIAPSSLGLATATDEELAGGDPATNVKIAQAIFAGKPGPKRDIVLLNAAAALLVAGLANNFFEALDLAAKSVDEGCAAGKLQELLSFAG